MRKRIAELDILRALAAIAVVMIHVTATPMATLPVSSRSFFWVSLLNQWSRFSIPAFVLITGLVLWVTYGDRTDFAWGEFFRKRLKAIAVPYLVWTVLYLLLRARIEGSWSQLPQNFFWSTIQGSAMYQLYFIALIFQFYLLFPLVRPLARGRWLGVAVGLAVIFQGILMWDTYYGLFTQQATAPWALGILRWRDRLFPWWLGYFMVGAWMATQLDRLLPLSRRYVWPLLGAAAGLLGWMMVEYMKVMAQPGASVGFAATGYRPSAYLYALVGVLALLGLSSRVISWGSTPGGMGAWVRLILLELGKHSFGIFLVHPMMLYVVTRLLQSFSLTPLVYMAVVFPVVLAASYLFSRLVSILPFGHWIVGRT